MRTFKQLSVLALLGLITVSAKQKNYKLAQSRTSAKDGVKAKISQDENCDSAPESYSQGTSSGPVVWEEYVGSSTQTGPSPTSAPSAPVWEEIVSSSPYAEPS